MINTKSKSHRLLMAKYFFVLLFVLLFACSGFVYKKKIVGDYYLIGVDTKMDISLSLKLNNGNFIGRIGRVKQYAVVNDSLIFAKSMDAVGRIGYYILNIKRDFDVAEVRNVVVGPIDEELFFKNWARKYNINFISVINNR